MSWEWQSADCSMGKARLGGGAIGRKPTDRGKAGSKKSILVDAAGGPLSAAVAGANVHDTKLLEPTLKSIVVARPAGTLKTSAWTIGYDNPTGHGTVAAYQYVAHIRRIGEEKLAPWGPANLPRPTVGGGTHLGLAVQVPRDIGALRQEVGQLLGPASNWLVPSSGTVVNAVSPVLR